MPPPTKCPEALCFRVVCLYIRPVLFLWISLEPWGSFTSNLVWGYILVGIILWSDFRVMGQRSQIIFFCFFDISRTVRWIHIKLGMRVYPGRMILYLHFKVTGSKVKGHRPFFCYVDISRTVRWIYIKLGMRVYPGGMILCLDFKVTGSKVKGHSLFCEKKKFCYNILHTMRYMMV